MLGTLKNVSHYTCTDDIAKIVGITKTSVTDLCGCKADKQK
jgi:hypothetical protein